MTSVTTCGVTIGSNRISEVMIRDDDSKHCSSLSLTCRGKKSLVCEFYE